MALKDTGTTQPIPLPKNSSLEAFWIKLTIESVYAGHQVPGYGHLRAARCVRTGTAMIRAARRQKRCARGIFTMVLMIGIATNLPAGGGQGPSQPHEFVYLRDVDPTIIQDVRYASANNFTGRPLPGYGAAECILLAPVAEALKRVQADLARRELSLKVYDCYRPQRAVQSFVRWANDGNANEMTKRFHPRLNKNELLAKGYIAPVSGHSRGNAIDLTLVELPAKPQPAFDPKRIRRQLLGTHRAQSAGQFRRHGDQFRLLRPQKWYR